MKALSISEGRKRLFELRGSVVSDHDQVILTHKQGNIVLISMDEWESYKETQLLLKDKEALRALIKSFDDHDNEKKKGKSMNDIFPDLV
jgi:prevent-host-death family protein